uniref:Uncharacterized protein n=1 Tax=Solanum lycopersicum TaxID=4081 RepID=A0A3Q7GGB4_SOLLC
MFQHQLHGVRNNFKMPPVSFNLPSACCGDVQSTPDASSSPGTISFSLSVILVGFSLH